MTRERMDRMKTYSITDTGALREMNQDYFFASDDPVGNLPNLFIVAQNGGFMQTLSAGFWRNYENDEFLNQVWRKR